jgi:CheY-like chemotaxis protein/anti-sigma regulatory factor (Ser/Thr protein kinase)
VTSDHSGAKLLVVEDDPAFQQIVCSLFRRRGLIVTGVSNGTAAMEFLDATAFDLVLLDLGLPGVGGLEVLARLYEREPRPKVIVITGDTTTTSVLESVRSQAYQYLVKPITTERLIEVVEDALAAPEPMPITLISGKSDWVELLVPCEANAPERVQSFLQQLEGELPEDTRESVGRAFRELLMNAIEWGGELDPTRTVRISFLRAKRMLLYRIGDPGAGFQPDELRHAAVENPPGEPFRHLAEREDKGLRPGGFGLMMVRSLVDELIYNDAHNEVVFIKYLD